jgi:hypothetical protein
MKFETIFSNHTDIISDWLFITCWSFDIDGLKTNFNSCDYSNPVRKAIMNALSRIAGSGNKRIRERSFTIFMGDHDEGYQHFGVGIRYSTYRKVKDIFTSEFNRINGFLYETNGRIPYTPFIPYYRYTHGKIIEYTYETALAGKKYIDKIFESGLSIRYRMWMSAEVSGLKQKYIKKG